MTNHRSFVRITLGALALLLVSFTRGSSGGPLVQSTNYPHWAKVYSYQDLYGSRYSVSAAGVRPTPDGGLVVASTRAYAGSDLCVEQMGYLKLSPWGRVVWTTAGLECQDQGESRALAVAVLADGRVAALGRYQSDYSAQSYVTLFMHGSGGGLKWTRTLLSSYDEGASYDLQPSSDGGLLIAAFLKDGHWLARLDSAGTILWQKRLDASVFSLRATADGGFVAAGTSVELDDPSSDAWIAKFDALGAISWQKSIGDPGAADGFRRVVPVADGYLAAGETAGLGSSRRDVWLVKFDLAGGLVWQRAFARSKPGAYHRSSSLVPLSGGGLLLAGFPATYDGDYYAEFGFALSLTSEGAIVWARRYKFRISDVIQTSKGDLVMTGDAIPGTPCIPGGYGRFVVARLDAKGKVGSACCLIGAPDIVGRTTAAVAYDANLTLYDSPAVVGTLAIANPGSYSVRVDKVCVSAR